MEKLRALAVTTLCSTVIITGCATKGEEYQANVFKAGQVNQAQEVKTVELLVIQAGKIEVDNAEAKKNAQVIGGLLGAVAGGVGANLASRNSGAATTGGVLGGGAAGVAAGSLVVRSRLITD